MECKQCKKKFEKNSYQQVFCSKQCRLDWWAEWDKRNIHRYRARQKRYLRDNPEKVKEKSERFYHSPKGVFGNIKSRSKRANISFGLEQRRFIKWLEKQERKCFYCGVPEELMNKLNMNFNKRVKRLSIDRTDSTKGYIVGNIVLACYRCNSIKGDFFTKQEMVKIANLFIKPKLQP